MVMAMRVVRAVHQHGDKPSRCRRESSTGPSM